MREGFCEKDTGEALIARHLDLTNKPGGAGK